jgi:glycosyltransferase involved in cell wall biosynthesis
MPSRHFSAFTKQPDLLKKPIIDVIIPAYNEEKSIGLVIADIPDELVREIIVCNNNSSDQTAMVARQAGATVVDQPQKGYGSACLKGMEHISRKAEQDQPDIVVFLDGDYSDHPEEMSLLIRPIVEEGMDLVIGSRALGDMERGAMMPQQVFGNWLATNLIRLFYNYHFTDLGPFRAIRWDKLQALRMEDPDFGWTVEMQVKAAKYKLDCTEIPVSYRKRVGVSKVSGTIRGTILAGHKILWTIFKLW